MLTIIKTEWLKIKKYPAFWWVMGITALTYPGINYMFLNIYYNITEQKSASGQVVKMLIGNPFSFPEAWRTVGYFSSLFVFIPAIVIIMLITNEYTYKTNRQNIIDGWSRRQFMFGKFADVVMLSLLVTAMYTLVAFFIGQYNTTDANASASKLAYYIGLFFLQTLSQLSLAFLVGLIVRKSFIALAIFTFYYIIVEPIASKLIEFKLNSQLNEYLPLEISHRLLPKPAFLGKIDEKGYALALQAVNYHIWYTLLLIGLTWVLCFWIYNKRDL